MGAVCAGHAGSISALSDHLMASRITTILQQLKSELKSYTFFATVPVVVEDLGSLSFDLEIAEAEAAGLFVVLRPWQAGQVNTEGGAACMVFQFVAQCIEVIERNASDYEAWQVAEAVIEALTNFVPAAAAGPVTLATARAIRWEERLPGFEIVMNCPILVSDES